MALRILIAEDEWIIAATLRHQLLALGHEVTATVGTGVEALARGLENGLDLTLMDIQMPEMDGLTATSRLMTDRPHPVVIVTGRATNRAAAEAAGAMEYVLKPILTHQLPVIIEAALARFGRFCAVRAEALDGAQALTDWVRVQDAMRGLMAERGMLEEEAFAHLREVAAVGRLTLAQAAREIIAGR
jgi:two-component system, response regulator PdtaR